MGMNADVIARDILDHFADDGLDLVWHGAAIGVAQHHPARAGLMGRLGAVECEFRVLLVAVEEVLAVEHDLAARGLRRRDAVADRGEVLLVGGLQRDPHLIGGGFRDKADRVRLGFEQPGDARIVGDGASGAARHAERGEAGVIERRPFAKNSVSVGLAPG